jgi:hypothetical protein
MTKASSLGSDAFMPGHHHGVPLVGRAAKAFADFLLVLDLDSALGQLPAGSGKIGPETRIIGKAD